MKEIQDRSGAPAIEGEGNRASIRNILATLKQPGETREVLERHGLDEQQFPQVTADVLQAMSAVSMEERAAEAPPAFDRLEGAVPPDQLAALKQQFAEAREGLQRMQQEAPEEHKQIVRKMKSEIERILNRGRN